ncbi:MAG: PAS domain-containing protein [Chloroflexi bacterium]|nr:PAS domain-containing protein [Chloroflexota bacterium]
MTTKKKTPQNLTVDAEVQPVAKFPIVGIGASAGGLAAFEAFLSGMPADSEPGMAFVLVQHLAPDHKSILTELVKRYTRMQVFEVEDGMVVQPNCAYIIPPNRDMAFLNGTLQLLEMVEPRGQRLPIDYFFRSLAQDQQERAICIVLSGTGSDGSLGVRAVKAQGGMAMAQTPETTEYDGMPRSAIGTGLVDYVLAPRMMPDQLIKYVAHAFGKITYPLASPAQKTEDILKKIFVLLRAQTGHDFSSYKSNTIARRIERRMAVQQVEQLDAYLRFLQQTPKEVEALFRDLLIGVTNFFRDPDAFSVLQGQAVVRMLAGKTPNSLVRVWVPGCSTGEEAYSIAILLQEQMDAQKQNFAVQIFATDIDNQAIEQARSGVYSASIAADMSPERLSRFFTPVPDGANGRDVNFYQVQKIIRNMLIFSEQDVIKDPPFSKLDLISCRNLLIYMNTDLQKRLIPLFHYALNPGGFLFLGTSETVGEYMDLFSLLERKSKLYQRSQEPYLTNRLSLGSMLPYLPVNSSPSRSSTQTTRDPKLHLRELTERALLDHYGAVAVLVTERGEITYLHGRTGHFLEPAPGEADLNIIKMARDGLRQELVSALHQAVALREPVLRLGLRVKTNGSYSLTDMTVRPVPAGSSGTSESILYLVILEEKPEAVVVDVPAAAVDVIVVEPDVRIAALKQELRAKEEYLQTTNEELETTNEELKSSNEEMQSVNEELQSTNEELETSKEELQSVNEELSTVNAELQQKVSDLTRANNDMNNLLAGTGIGTIFVDYQLHIQRFTPAVMQVINLIMSDVGRPVGHIVSNLVGYDSLVSDVKSVLDSLLPKEVEVQTQSGDWYLLRIRPYRTLENVIEGAVITFTEINELKKVKVALKQTEVLRRLAAVVEDSRDAVMVQSLDGRILAWNPAAVNLYGWSETEARTMNIRELIPAEVREAELSRVQKAGQEEISEAFHSQRKAKNGKVLNIRLTTTALFNQSGEMYAIASTERVVGE